MDHTSDNILQILLFTETSDNIKTGSSPSSPKVANLDASVFDEEVEEEWAILPSYHLSVCT